MRDEELPGAVVVGVARLLPMCRYCKRKMPWFDGQKFWKCVDCGHQEYEPNDDRICPCDRCLDERRSRNAESR